MSGGEKSAPLTLSRDPRSLKEYVQELMVDPWAEEARCQPLCLASHQPDNFSRGLFQALSAMGVLREHSETPDTASTLWELPVSQGERPGGLLM